LNIRLDERHIGQSSGLRVRATCVEKGAATIEPDDRPGGPDPPRKFDRGIAPTASNVQYAVGALEWQRWKHFCAMLVETSGENVPPRVEFWNEYGVPEVDVLIVVLE
jgi:hypothetical protein